MCAAITGVFLMAGFARLLSGWTSLWNKGASFGAG
jgi:hypothetical protein